MSKIISCRMFCGTRLGNALHNYENLLELLSSLPTLLAQFLQDCDRLPTELKLNVD